MALVGLELRKGIIQPDAFDRALAIIAQHHDLHGDLAGDDDSEECGNSGDDDNSDDQDDDGEGDDAQRQRSDSGGEAMIMESAIEALLKRALTRNLAQPTASVTKSMRSPWSYYPSPLQTRGSAFLGYERERVSLPCKKSELLKFLCAVFPYTPRRQPTKSNENNADRRRRQKTHIPVSTQLPIIGASDWSALELGSIYSGRLPDGYCTRLVWVDYPNDAKDLADKAIAQRKGRLDEAPLLIQQD